MTKTAHEPVVFRLAQMSGFEFEDAVCTVFDRLGYDATVAERVADLGRDVIARSDGETLVVECKHTSSTVGRPVVQKLHSATVSLDESARGMIVSTGGFSRPAREHAAKLGEVVELWDYPRLAREARRVEAYFESEERGDALVFQTDNRAAPETRRAVGRSLLEPLDSSPRELARAVDLRVEDRRSIPAVLVEYELDATFGTSTYPNLHRARDRGRRLFSAGKAISPTEQQLWSDASFDVRCERRVRGRPPSAQFDVDLGSYEERVARDVANRESTVVEYRGDNNVTYQKECEVDPGDVTTRTLRVLIERHAVRLEAGPSEYVLEVAARRRHLPIVVDSDPIAPDCARALQTGGDGVLCNDCGAIEPSSATPEPASCQVCGRTLCSSHHWDEPTLLPWTSHPVCSSCYPRDGEGPPPFPFEGGAGATAASLVPPIPLALAGRTVAAALSFGIPICALAAAAAVGPSTTGGTVALTSAAAMWLGAVVWMLSWAHRSRLHRGNLRELETYEPVWTTETGA